MLAAFRRFFHNFFGNPEEEIIERELINENNKRPLPELCDGEHSLEHQNKRHKRLYEGNNGKLDGVNNSCNASMSPASSHVSNGLDSFRTENIFPTKRSTMEKSIPNHSTSSGANHLKKMHAKYLVKENLPSTSCWQLSDLSFKQVSALSDLNKMREKLAYNTLIKSQRSSILSEYNRSTLMQHTLVDLTKEIGKPIELSKPSANAKISSVVQKPTWNNNFIPSNITVRKTVKSPTTKHTEWIHDLNKKYCQTEVQRQLKIQDEQLRSRVLHENNKIFDKVLNERLLRQLKVKEVIEIEPEDEDSEEEIETGTILPVFTEAEEKRITRAMKSPSQQQLIEKFGYIITGACVYSLSGLNWLNDNVINFYMKLLTQRGEEPGKLKVYAMNSFFCVNMRTRGYSSVRRWTRKVDIFSYDLIPIPVHVNGVHWCMLMVNFRNKTLKYYDSMGGSNKMILDLIEQYLKEESLDKKKTEFDFSDWEKESVKDIPQQMNGCDCGVFSCMFAEYICRGAKINFTQQQMPYFRRKMCLEILEGKLLT